MVPYHTIIGQAMALSFKISRLDKIDEEYEMDEDSAGQVKARQTVEECGARDQKNVEVLNKGKGILGKNRTHKQSKDSDNTDEKCEDVFKKDKNNMDEENKDKISADENKKDKRNKNGKSKAKGDKDKKSKNAESSDRVNTDDNKDDDNEDGARKYENNKDENNKEKNNKDEDNKEKNNKDEDNKEKSNEDEGSKDENWDKYEDEEETYGKNEDRNNKDEDNKGEDSKDENNKDKCNKDGDKKYENKDINNTDEPNKDGKYKDEENKDDADNRDEDRNDKIDKDKENINKIKSKNKKGNASKESRTNQNENDIYDHISVQDMPDVPQEGYSQSVSFTEAGVSPEDEAFTIANLKAKVFGAFSWDNFFYAIIFGLGPTSWDVISDWWFAERLTEEAKDAQSAGLCYLFVCMPGLFCFQDLFLQWISKRFGWYVTTIVYIMFSLAATTTMIFVYWLDPLAFKLPSIFIGCCVIGVKLVGVFVHTPEMKAFSIREDIHRNI